MSPEFDRLYSTVGRPSIAPEKLLRALLIQVLYTVRSERMLMEQLNYNMLFRWFVGLEMHDPIWVPPVFSKNRDRLLGGRVAKSFLSKILEQASRQDLLSNEHFYGRWDVDRSLGESEEFPAQGPIGPDGEAA
jgi:transposase